MQQSVHVAEYSRAITNVEKAIKVLLSNLRRLILKMACQLVKLYSYWSKTLCTSPLSPGSPPVTDKLGRSRG